VTVKFVYWFIAFCKMQFNPVQLLESASNVMRYIFDLFCKIDSRFKNFHLTKTTIQNSNLEELDCKMLLKNDALLNWFVWRDEEGCTPQRKSLQAVGKSRRNTQTAG
jgi:hypothetical protein